LLGTLGGRVGQRELPHSLTTPDAVSLASLFSEMVAAGAETAVMEVSSHAIEMGRILGLSYRVAVFTNLSANEHLDFHGTIEAYRAAKLRLFSEHLDLDGTAVIYADDPSAEWFGAAAERVLTFGQGPAHLQAAHVVPSLRGSRFVLSLMGPGNRCAGAEAGTR
jgi:UDP-N-acetylmuramoyl-L-alanyl-D-glutamate--2,6-diaminopimelate ligase